MQLFYFYTATTNIATDDIITASILLRHATAPVTIIKCSPQVSTIPF